MPWCGFTPRGRFAGAASSRSIAGSWSKSATRRITPAMIIRPGASRSASMALRPTGGGSAAAPETIAAADGEAASRMVPKIRAAVEGYQWRSYGDYRAWPGPNSNTFVAAVLAAVPELQAALPPTAIGKDFPYNGDVFGLTPSGTGIRITLRRLSRPHHRLGRRPRDQSSSARWSASICAGRRSNCRHWGVWVSVSSGWIRPPARALAAKPGRSRTVLRRCTKSSGHFQ